MPIPRAAAALVTVGMVACSGPPTNLGAHVEDTASSYAGPYAIDDIQSSCTPGNPDQWNVSVHTQGWADRVVLTMAPPAQDTGSPDGATSEEHPLDNVDYDPTGAWDQWAVTLLHVQVASELEPGATTEFACADKDTLAMAAVMYQAGAPDTVADCAWWGASPATRFGSIQGMTCTCENPDGNCS